jgi:hypothetical protein
MDDTLRKFHGQKVWQLNPYSCIKDIEVRATYDNDDAFTYMVFNFPYSALRAGASSFCDFKQTGKAQAMKDALLFYLKLVQSICSSGKDTKSAKCVCFLETVQRNGISIGVRIWLFSNRVASEPHANCISVIMNNDKLYSDLQRKTPKTEVKLASHQTWMKVKSLPDYLNVISTYSNNESNLKNCEDVHDTLKSRDCPMGPAAIFSIDSQGFTYNFGSMNENIFPQNDITNYTDGASGQFQFPNEKLVLRCHPEQLTVEELIMKKKYLPSYFFEKVRLPSCEVESIDVNDMGIGVQTKVTIPNHIHRMKKVDGQPLIDVARHYDLQNNNDGSNTFVYDTWTYKQYIEPMIRKVFVISYVDTNSDEPHWATNGIKKFLRYKHKYKPKKELSDVWFTDVLTDMKKDPGTKTLLADKYSLDTLDMMKYKQELLEEYHTENRRAFQEEMMDEFIRNVVKDVNGNVSEPVQSMIHWFNNVYKPRMKILKKKSDPDGSVFLNAIAQKLNFFDEDLQVSTGHPTLMLLQHAKYDTFRQQLNLHFNAIFTGEGATSKSYLFEKMKQMSISGTISELTYQTKRANAVEKDQNDIITVFNEAPAGLFMSNNGKDGDKEQEAAFKEKLTSQITRCNTFVKDEETEKRDNKTTISQAIGTYFGATNDDPSAASEAMSTRFFWGEFEKVERKNKTIDMCMRGEKAWQDIGKDDLNRTLHNLHLEQFQMMLLYKLMFIGTIKYPTLDVSDFVYEQVARSLRGQKVETTTRFKERYDILCQIFTMCNALDTVYNFQGGIHAGEPFDPATLLDVEPYLYCTEEIAIFCFTILANEVYNPSETKIIKAVWKLWNAAGGNKYEKSMLEDGTQSVNYDYIKINKTGLKLLQCIQQAIPNHEGRPSEHNIKAVLKKLKKKSFPMYPMVHATAIVDISMRLYNDTKPEREPGRSSTRVNDGMREDSDAYFNIQLFDKLRRNVDNDPIVTAVANTRHRHTKPKKIIFGCPTRINAVIQYPSVFKVIQQRPATTKELKRKNPLFKTKASQNLRQHPGYQLKEEEKHKGSVLKTDFDCWGCVQHAKKLKVPGNKLANFYQRFNHELVEETIVSFDEEHRINYPTDVINQIKERHNPGENDTYIDTYQDFDFDGLNNQQRAKRLRIE